MLAAISGESLIWLVIQLLIFGLVYFIISWGVAQIAPPEPFAKIIRVVLVLAVVIFLINALLGLGGRPFITWGR